MEDVLEERVESEVALTPLKNGEVTSVELAADSDKEDDEIKTVKVNGDTNGENCNGTDSSDCDTLVIDERPQGSRKRKLLLNEEEGFRGFKRTKCDNDYVPPTNPYFNKSLFELSELHQNTNDKDYNSDSRSEKPSTNEIYKVGEETHNSSLTSTSSPTKKPNNKKKKNGSPKLREYAQYLGLQPTVQFKCSKCGLAGFPSLPLLNEHHKQCRALTPIVPPVLTNTSSAPSTNFRVTRKVFLCSACGTYYENWNLFLHMREVHKRFICLYCLGMFSIPDKLSLHLVSKHNCVPSQLDSEEDFFQLYKEPCFLMCCDCEKVFNEHDNFFGHHCVGKPNKGVVDSKNKNTTNNLKNSMINQKQTNKTSKQAKNKTFVEHVTGDMSFAPLENSETAENEKLISETVSEKANESLEDKTNLENETPLQNETSCDDSIPETNEKNDEEILKNNPIDSTQNKNEIDSVKPELTNNLTGNETENHKLIQEDNPQLNKSESEAEAEDNILVEPSVESKSDVAQTDIEEEPQKEEEEEEIDSEQEETRKVPKVTLKLPKLISTTYAEHEDSDDSDKLTMELDSIESNSIADEKENKEPSNVTEPQLTVAGSDIPIIELELEYPLDKFDIQKLLQKCLKETIATCIYCNHARKIAVNGKQLGLHTIAEHRFSAVVNSITAEELIPESFVMRIKESLPELQDVYFNLESSSREENVTFSHVFECFQCRFSTNVHKELYLHNRKMHAKTILLCIMCKSNFYSYSELICHLCPGLYELNNDVSFRCCMCVGDDLPSAFRLMVHLRKRHHACDVCLELCHNQSKLSNHVWKHKLHHLCYRCGIAYRNKPDITKHLFWKHGTESVLCKKCLQKKWPHVYHFCIPPTTFTCEECNLNFTKAVALKVHKRFHTDVRPHTCTYENCKEMFISKKLLLKHEFKHRELPEEILGSDAKAASKEEDEAQEADVAAEINDEKSKVDSEKDENSSEAADKPASKPIVDVYDLPELNLSESDSSDSEDETDKNVTKAENDDKAEETQTDVPELNLEKNTPTESVVENLEVKIPETSSADQQTPVLDNIWDDFKNYQASMGKMEGVSAVDDVPETSHQEIESSENVVMAALINDHDYCLLSQESSSKSADSTIEVTQSTDHDYCFLSQQQQKPTSDLQNEQQSAPAVKNEKASSSSDSTDSDSSSCTCGSNCSCSGSSNSSSSSSDSSDSDSSSSEGRKRQQARRERRKQKQNKEKTKNKETDNSPIDVVATDNQTNIQVEQVIEESDLDTTETETDEDFYDKQPQKLANKLFAEKRKELLLLAGIGPLMNGSILESSRPSTPSLPETEEVKPKKKSKNKKKKKKSKKQEEKQSLSVNIPITNNYQPPIVSPLTISLPKNSPLSNPSPSPIPNNISSVIAEQSMFNTDSNMSDSSIRASKRRRIPNKFYGYSSDEEHDRYQPPILKWRKMDLPSPVMRPPPPPPPMIVPPLTIKTIPPPQIPEEPLPARTMINVEETHSLRQEHESGTESNETSSEEEGVEEEEEEEEGDEEEEEPQPPPPPKQLQQFQPPPFTNNPSQPPLYCYCRCPYDEVSEMIGCDANDCNIEWFHFECVGIMVPPKGQWFCPDCRKKKQQKKELAQT